MATSDYLNGSQYWGNSYWGSSYWGLLVGIPVDIPYTEVMEFTVTAYTTAEFDVVLPNNTSVDVDVLGEVVSGAGSTAVNGTYAEYGTRDGKTRYRMASAESATGYFYIVWITDYNMWVIGVKGEDNVPNLQVMSTARYYSNGNVATPDLVTTWIKAQGVVPLPTISIPSIPTLSTLVSLTVEMPQLVLLTVYKELSK